MVKIGRKLINLKGQRFNRLLVIKEVGRSKDGHVLWKCLCDCGAIKIICSKSLRCEDTQSCGCLQKEKVSEAVSEKTKRKISKANLGKTRSKEAKKKMSKAKIGKKCPKHSKKMMGENNLNYNPNITDEERKIRREYPEYREWRKLVYERDSYTCQCCGNNKGSNLVAHHLDGYDNHPELRTTLSNGITLCTNCHNNFHHQYGKGNNTKEQFEEFVV